MRLANGFVVIGIVCSSVFAAEQGRRTLTFEDRVAAQTAIEQVYWNHRIWPKENPGPKPELSAVMPDEAIRAKVEDYLKKSNALRDGWSRPITGEQLQAEIDRMAKGTHDPQVLQELFSALGNDPFLIAETLGRQTLADRLIRNWYVNDTRFHADVRAKAEAALNACRTMECLRSISGQYRETSLKLESKSPDGNAQLKPRIELALDRAIPVGRLSSLKETSEAFVVSAVLSRTPDAITTATVAWPKAPFESWWQGRARFESATVSVSPTTFEMPNLRTSACVEDTWTPMHQDNADPRAGHRAVWTGNEMIISGGGADEQLNSGSRYNPSTDTWRATSMVNVPDARSNHSAVWTGTEMVVWGGGGNATLLNTGGRYDPSEDVWRPISTTNAPAARVFHSTVWTGTEMIVWGGQYGPTYFNSGGRYSPTTDSWSATSVGANVPDPRADHTAVWTGARMIVWGGSKEGPGNFVLNFSSGALYDPSTDSWTPTAFTSQTPEERSRHSAVWTGTEMIVCGGWILISNSTSAYPRGCGRYDPSTNLWRSMSLTHAPSGRVSQTAVWTGTEMIIWGGGTSGGTNNTITNSGGRYNPGTDSWVATSTGTNVPAARFSATGVWTGTELIVWGGEVGLPFNGRVVYTGGRYNPMTDSWVPTSNSGPEPRIGHSAIWTGSEMVVWGGNTFADRDTPLNSGGRYDPATDTWKPTSLDSTVPAARYNHTTVWTGTEMLIWGGTANSGVLSSGSRYDPASDTWAPIAIQGAPEARSTHSAAWTGNEMIVSGGAGSLFNSNPLNSGGRYSPSVDTWLPTSIGPNTPSARYQHTAVWTGSEMIVWGGAAGNTYFNTGGRYNPSTDTWIVTSTGTNVPAARHDHTSVWTGSEMIVWGGHNAGFLDDGDRYNPLADSWAPIATDAAPEARYGHAAVWTGSEMIVWGGDGPPGDFDSGGRYLSASDQWRPTSTTGAPSARVFPSAVWTGSSVIVWGGEPYTYSGGVYCVCPDSHAVYRDADGDGYGDGSVATTSSCDGTVPAGYVENSLDCDDANPRIYANAPELNDGIDNECPGDAGYGVIDEISGTSGFMNPGDKMQFGWIPQDAASSYDVVRSATADFSAGCTQFTASQPFIVDSELPPAGSVFYYLVRASTPHTGSWGQNSDGTPRAVSCLGAASLVHRQ